METLDQPYADTTEAAEHFDLGEGVHRVNLRFGFAETPDVPEALKSRLPESARFHPGKATFFLGRETYGVGPENRPPVALDRGEPLRAFSGAAFLPHPPDMYLDEAFEEHDDALCVPRQMAVLLNKPLNWMIDSFSEILDEGWRSVGVRPQEIEAWAALHGHPYFLVRAGKLVKIVEPPEKVGKAIAYTIYDGHATAPPAQCRSGAYHRRARKR